MAECSSHVAVNLKLLGCSFDEMMADKLIMSLNASIFRTPKILFRHNERAYLPNAFSFGPFHHADEQLKLTHRIKWKYVQGFLRRSPNPAAKWRQLTDAIRSVKGAARECYAGSIEFGEEEFLEILVVDGCFIVELFRKDSGLVGKDQDDPIFNMSCLLQYLNHDLILLENQIPWLVLERLFSLTKVSEQQESLIKLTLDFFGNIFSSTKPDIKLDKFNDLDIKHILDLLRHSLLLPLEREKQLCDKNLGWEPFPCATKIHEAGIKLRKRKSDSILDIQFTEGVLEIPSLLIQETTETIFRNLISFEQCCPNYPPIVTSYAKLMDNLIDTNKDVDILCDKNVIDNWLNPEDVTQFFNKLYNDAYVKKFYYSDLCEEVTNHRKLCWPRWRFFYMHNYFGTPWAIVSQVVGTILLILAIVQTLYAILDYGKSSDG
ncbi:hypothetical protein OWV82_002216 [Melia azedarach]|uniref:Uncharacterized protein n=1 Tax=Melia azedarach TaxID=155640 RepID=A0ACC1Z3I3_MELAZ|nr:hypothetical protein OWV82_002216 [Melia azedarach]